MSDNPSRMDHFNIKVNGAILPIEVMDNVVDIVVDHSLDVPSMATMTFHDDEIELIDQDKFPLGATLEIQLTPPHETEGSFSFTTVFKGEITGISPNFQGGTSNHVELVVLAYDKSHRLHRETKTKVWLNKKDSDIAQAIAGEAGLSPQIEATSEVFKHVYQDALTDMEFLKRRAARIGYEVYVDDEKLYFQKPDPKGSATDLNWGEEIDIFRPVVTIAHQVNEVTVQGWDPKKKEKIMGKATTSKTHPAIGIGKWGGQAAQSALSGAKKLEVRQPVQSQADADSVAKAILDSINSDFITAEGSCLEGLPALKAGQLVNIIGVGTRFSGKYKLTSVEHSFSAENFMTVFNVTGSQPEYVARMLSEEQSARSRWAGVVSAIVTNNNAPDDWGQVKVKFPWLDETQESFWARLSGPGFGKERGIYFLPEVNDEVLVAFEQGDFNRPYILGGLYNGKDAPAVPIAEATGSGDVKTRAIRTRTGHIIRFVDDMPGGSIEIIDAKENTKMIMDAAGRKITLDSQGDLDITTVGNIKLEASGNIDIKATAQLNLEGATVNSKALGAGTFEANGPVTVKGATLTAQGNGMAELKGATVSVSGGLVRIN